MNNTVIFKDFDELQRAIAESRKAWENGTNAQMMKKADTYHGIWKELNRSRFSGRMSIRTQWSDSRNPKTLLPLLLSQADGKRTTMNIPK